MKKILCLSRAPLNYRGGIPRTCINIYGENNFNVEVHSYDLTNSNGHKIKRRINNINEIVHPSEFVRGTIAFSKSYLNYILKNSNQYDYIHIQHPDPLSALGCIISKLIYPKCKIVVTWHAEIYKSYLLFAPILILIDLILFHLSYKLIYFTPYHIKDSILSNVPSFRKKIILIPHCIKSPIINPSEIDKKRNISIQLRKEIRIISIGRLVEYKGYEYAIKSLKNVDKKVIYTIIGSGPLKDKLMNLVNTMNLEDRVKFLGQVSDKQKEEVLYNSDIFLFPSINKSEAYGLVQLEAMFFRLPIINTYLGNGVNYLAPREISMTCRVKSKLDISKAINKLISDNSFYIHMSNKSYRNSMNYNFKDMIEKYKLLYK